MDQQIQFRCHAIRDQRRRNLRLKSFLAPRKQLVRRKYTLLRQTCQSFPQRLFFLPRQMFGQGFLAGKN